MTPKLLIGVFYYKLRVPCLQKLEIQSTPCQTVTQSVSTAQIDYSISSSDKNMESPNSSHEPENKPFHVNQYAIRDPRKNFLWENFNRHYKPS
jgi:hypothetical protein